VTWVRIAWVQCFPCRYGDIWPCHLSKREKNWRIFRVENHERRRYYTAKASGARAEWKEHPDESRQSFRSKSVSWFVILYLTLLAVSVCLYCAIMFLRVYICLMCLDVCWECSAINFLLLCRDVWLTVNYTALWSLWTYGCKPTACTS
jgi:hypothetical protein